MSTIPRKPGAPGGARTGGRYTGGAYTGEFKPFLKGPRTAPASLRERIVHFERVKQQQQRLLTRTAMELHVAGHTVDHASLQRAAPSLTHADLAADRLLQSAHAVRLAMPALAEALRRLAGGGSAEPVPGKAPAQ